ncbi:glutathione synthetase ATP-binding domain-like protein [Rhizodiscina lignyota]|uniref:Glutathione synthetase ATP-binding domain-like protein n=1 Tax=Rhizodiscina lignyota TaxID=1504668 RepID=A0A9P4IMA9_9PEZI|nr:glutathione synthetase ATP-binding domain-like protein [Rhizodiscina lignyota]
MAARKFGGEHCTITVISGGPTPEYISSIESALGVLSHRGSLRAHFRLVPCLITRSGLWLDESTSELALSAYSSGGPDALQRMEDIASSGTSVPPWLVVSSSSAVFPTIGGALGEDGVILGLCRALNTPFVGCDILTSVICLDKSVCKSVLETANLPQTVHLAILPSDSPYSVLESSPFPFPWIIKPADGGCSIGVSLINSPPELSTALDKVRQPYPDSTVLIEPAVQDMVEVDVAVMEDISATGDRIVIVSPCGLRQNFRLGAGSSASSSSASSSSQGKQNKGDGPSWVVPAPDVPKDVVVKMQAFARQAFRAVRATGFMRVDFFYVASTGEILINEINTIPNMSRDSMWFKLWAGAGIVSEEWVKKVVEVALWKGEKKQRSVPLSKI